MKHLKIYERFDIINPPENWKVGDIVVAVRGSNNLAGQTLVYYSSRGGLVKNRKYEIVDIEDTSHYAQTPERFPIKVKDEESNFVTTPYGNTKLDNYYLKDNFISLDDWEFRQNTKKYNL
jgi:hypothetical protein